MVGDAELARKRTPGAHTHGATEGTGSSYLQDMDSSSYQANIESVAEYKRMNEPQAGESHTRSILKGVTWRFVASMTTIIIAWLVTGEVAIAFQIGLIEVFAKLLIYYIHERIWARIII
jgi:uncharacterized membrane protein